MTLEKAIAAFEQFTDLLPEENYFELEYWIDEIEDYFEKFRRCRRRWRNELPL